MKTTVISLGDKIDLRALQAIEQAKKTDQAPPVYKSIIYDIKSNGDLEIGMPAEAGKLVLLPLGVRYEIVCYTKGGLYLCTGQVKERYKSDNLYMLTMELKTALSKYQRREFYRFECTMNIQYLPIAEEDTKQLRVNDLKLQNKKAQLDIDYKTGVALDISGGGLRFVADEEMEKNSFLSVKLHLENLNVNREYYLPGKILYVRKVDNGLKKYECRVQFLLKDSRVREQIIKFIFEEERKSRKYNKG